MDLKEVCESVSAPQGMSNQEALQMLNRCKHEIQELRATIDRLAPKADAYDNLAAVLQLLPQRSVWMGENLVGVLDKRIQELTPKPGKAVVD